tara:strand:+ start:259 stop:474 length:216 start_codon:yes stop_codon:yes gene_type:complete
MIAKAILRSPITVEGAVATYVALPNPSTNKNEGIKQESIKLRTQIRHLRKNQQGNETTPLSMLMRLQEEKY